MTEEKRMDENESRNPAVIYFVGVGNAGNNAVNRMLKKDGGTEGISKVFKIDTDKQRVNGFGLKENEKPISAELMSKVERIVLGPGIGAGGKSEVGRKLAEEKEDDMRNAFKDADIIFVGTGAGGGTSTGSTPVVIQATKPKKEEKLKENDNSKSAPKSPLTVIFVEKPFSFEGKTKLATAEAGIKALEDLEETDTVIVVSNDKLLEIADDDTTMTQAFAMADDFLQHCVSTISKIFQLEGIINLDASDIRTIMERLANTSVMGVLGVGEAEVVKENGGAKSNYILEAAEAAATSLYLEAPIDGAKRVLICVIGREENIILHDVEEAADQIGGMVDPNAIIKFGAIGDETLGDKVEVIIVATGIGNSAAAVNETQKISAAGAETSLHPSEKVVRLFPRVPEVPALPQRRQR